MRIAEAAFKIERLVQARGRDGRSTEIEAVGIELGDSHVVVAYIYFANSEEPVLLLLDLATPVTEETLDRDAIKQVLLNSASAPSVH